MILVGSAVVRIDMQRRITLPREWASDVEQRWLLFPRHLVRSFQIDPGWMVLLPVGADARRSLDRLRASAFEFGLPPQVATLVETSTQRLEVQLTQPQIEWLGPLDRRVFVTGVLKHAQLCAPARWNEMISKTEKHRA